MISLFNSFHQFVKDLKIFTFRRELKWMITKEWNDYRTKFFSIKYFEAIAVFMIGAYIFLKIDISTAKEIREAI